MLRTMTTTIIDLMNMHNSSGTKYEHPPYKEAVGDALRRLRVIKGAINDYEGSLMRGKNGELISITWFLYCT